MAKPLVIVESPAKARTLTRFLGDKYRVEASYGHVRDLPENAAEVPEEIQDQPWGRLGVDIASDFTPYYVVPQDKSRHVQTLKRALKDASELLLATDPDREGESISWHLLQVLKPTIPYRRIVFHEITEDAVREAIEHSQPSVDEDLVRAQESRRILDRLYGYTLSPVLWKKVKTGLSAGRVQSIAVRLIVEREEARRAFHASTFWDLEATLRADGRDFIATLVRIGTERVASGRDFDPATGLLKGTNVRHVQEGEARALSAALGGALPWSITAVDERPAAERPAPPFTTSTLTQEASRKLGFSTERTMQIAQRLFQGMEIGGGEMEGLITYHRTDSTTLSDKALNEAARVIKEMFGAEYYQAPRRYQTKVRNAQEAHEAIRPTDFRQSPQKLAGVLDADEMRLYELIWKRTMASQMPDARVLKTTIEVTATAPDGTPCMFTVSGKAIQFAGFRRAYVEGSDDPAAELEEQETVLPACKVGDRVTAPGDGAIGLAGLSPRQHETAPPARYTEASLIKELEEAGIGRPSTYAPTIETIVNRGYVFRQRKALVPSFTAFAVTRLLREHFDQYVDVGFTAKLEDMLDQISNGKRDWLEFISDFYRGTDGDVGLEAKVARGDNIAFPVVDVGVDPESGQPIRVRIGRYGPFLQLGEGGPGNTASLPEDVAPADLTPERAMALVRAKAEGPQQLGIDPASQQTVFLMQGRFGPYVQLGETPDKADKKAPKPKRSSIPSSMSASSLTLEDALKLLDLPRVVGLHPADGQEITANFGRFGPYIKHGDEFRSLETEHDVFAVTLDRAVELLAAPKRARRRQASKTVIAELGPRPDTQAKVQLLEGRYGPYVTDGTTNASLPKGTNPAGVTIEEALELLNARAAAGPSKGRQRGRTGRTAAAGARAKTSRAGGGARKTGKARVG
ncbi:MAG: type I DNA topoisomerase [Vicinamibacterales bacterium]